MDNLPLPVSEEDHDDEWPSRDAGKNISVKQPVSELPPEGVM